MNKANLRRKNRVKRKVLINNRSNRNIVNIFRSNKNFYVQLIDTNGKIITSSCTLSLKNENKMTGIEKASIIGEDFAKKCIDLDVKEVVFNKSEYNYNGRVKALAESCRKSGLKF